MFSRKCRIHAEGIVLVGKYHVGLELSCGSGTELICVGRPIYFIAERKTIAEYSQDR